jgi:C4-dicarboxylate-specific signal transduction histidine kinase
MNSHSLHNARLQFIGKVLAICTHELRNHLAIIRESAGLIMDTVDYAISKRQVPNITKPLENIDKQANRSTAFLTVLSSFCHRLDHETSTFDINKLIEELLTLINRRLNQQEIVVSRDYEEDMRSVENCPSLLQFLLFCVIERLPNRSSLTIKTKSDRDGIMILLISDQPLEDDAAEGLIGSKGLIEESAKIMGIDVTIGTLECRLAIK